MNDLTGKKFGLLFVDKYVGEAKSRGKQLWRCKCDCGNYKVVQSNHLVYGKTKSCGCLHKRKGKDSPFFKGVGELPLDFYNKIRRSCHRWGRTLSFDVTPEYLWNLFLKQNRTCALTGVSIAFDGSGAENKHHETNKITASLDRIDSTKGYVKGNVQWVHKKINMMKGELTTDEFREWCRRVK